MLKASILLFIVLFHIAFATPFETKDGLVEETGIETSRDENCAKERQRCEGGVHCCQGLVCHYEILMIGLTRSTCYKRRTSV
uniref:U33-Eretoxin-Ek1b_1 n=1 Tax=Eresus cinnaberinus TaxID=175337 RepID=A0A2D0PBU1_ERECI